MNSKYRHNVLIEMLLTEGCIYDRNSGLNFELYKGGNEGENVPHFHIYNNEDFKSSKYFETCLRIDESEYFLHKPYHKRMNSKQKKLVLKFLKTKVKWVNMYMDVWHHMRYQWNMKFHVHIPNKMPDYSVLPTIG